MIKKHRPVLLTDRTLVTISGPDAAHFLQSVITTDIEKITGNDMLPGALLSPQGKVLFDFLIARRDNKESDGIFFIDIRSAAADAFIKRLGLYKLRANVKIHDKKQMLVHIFQENRPENESHHSTEDSNSMYFNDKRIIQECNIIRMYDFSNQTSSSADSRQNWDMLRIENGIAESGTDFEPGDVFPHDINYDQLGGLSFKKGCYIGQEVISRMQHRATVRRRVLIATGDSVLPAAGTTIEAAGKPIGTLGTVVGNKAIALARIDRLAAMEEAGLPVTVQAIPLTFSVPAHVDFQLSAHKGGE